jgi:hypothetical protein
MPDRRDHDPVYYAEAVTKVSIMCDGGNTFNCTVRRSTRERLRITIPSGAVTAPGQY